MGNDDTSRKEVPPSPAQRGKVPTYLADCPSIYLPLALCPSPSFDPLSSSRMQ